MEVYNNQNFGLCVSCHNRGPLESHHCHPRRHHHRPRPAGGGSRLLLCRNCHLKIEAHLPRKDGNLHKIIKITKEVLRLQGKFDLHLTEDKSTIAVWPVN